MSYKALCAGGLSFGFVRSEDIRKGNLKGYSMLFVPGGWASNKIKTLGEEGVSEIRKFVSEGGAYLGFCGGAGLATMDGLGLINVKRKPTKERVPSFSGRISLNLNQHPIWNGLTNNSKLMNSSLVSRHPSHVFYAWWPSEFIRDGEDIKVLATYGDALPDSFSSDLNVGDTAACGKWDEMESAYGIKLDPGRLRDGLAVVEGIYGKGRVLLSLVHFDTPGDENGMSVLRNLWEDLSGEKPGDGGACDVRKVGSGETGAGANDLPEAVAGLKDEIEELISLGARNFLWFWRNPILLQWRRGVRGLEYCTLYVMIKEIAEIALREAARFSEDADFAGRFRKGIAASRLLLDPFVSESKRLLVLERLAMQNGHVTYEKCDDPEIREIRMRLFGNSKSYGGLFKRLIDEIDQVLFTMVSHS